MKQQLLLGNEAIARGAWEAGAMVVSSYPGTPSTEITESAATYKEIHTEWAVNEKVALEVCVGASMAGGRAMSCMKHVGLNVAADPLFTASYTGVNGGLVLVVADDPGMHSSQNEQDSRFYARGALVPMLEPADSQECLDYTKMAFELSERFDTPVILRTGTRVAHARSLVKLGEREVVPARAYQKNPAKNVMVPSRARIRHVAVERRMDALREYVEKCPFNRMEMRDLEVGVITSGIAYQYVREALPEASVLKLGCVNPLPETMIKTFAHKVKCLYVMEELEPVIEEQVRALGIQVVYGKALTGRQGELSVNKIRALMGEWVPPHADEQEAPQRPPVMCAGCPHRGPFLVLNKLKARVMGDIGCYTLGAFPPLQALDTSLCMGASVGMAQGAERANPAEFLGKTVAVIGDSTFLHSGVTSLLSAVYNQSPMTLVILDNSTTGMTGHQPNPASGRDIHGHEAPSVDLGALCRACGVRRVATFDAFDLAGLEKALREEMNVQETSVIIAKRPCALLDKKTWKPAYRIDREACKLCMRCMQLGCPAIEKTPDGLVINPCQCVGCDLCAWVCGFGAILEGGDAE